MKKIFLVFAFCAGTAGFAISQSNTTGQSKTQSQQEQSIQENDLPDYVMTNFQKKYTARDAEWKIEDSYYGVTFTDRSGKKMHLVYDDLGVVQERNTALTSKEIPAKITNYIASTYPNYVIENLWRKEKQGQTWYKVQLNGNQTLGSTRGGGSGSGSGVGAGSSTESVNTQSATSTSGSNSVGSSVGNEQSTTVGSDKSQTLGEGGTGRENSGGIGSGQPVDETRTDSTSSAETVKSGSNSMGSTGSTNTGRESESATLSESSSGSNTGMSTSGKKTSAMGSGSMMGSEDSEKLTLYFDLSGNLVDNKPKNDGQLKDQKTNKDQMNKSNKPQNKSKDDQMKKRE